MYSKIIVFAAHYDDELTMAGTITMMSEQGSEVHIVNITDGCEGYPEESMRGEIVKMRKKEAAECDKVLGVKKRWHLDIPDMSGHGYGKGNLQKCIKIVRKVKPEAVFTHGPTDRHNDHRNTSMMTIDAVWHAGQPVSAALGDPWQTTFVYYYKGMNPGGNPLPEVCLDVTEYAHKRLEGMATQESQFSLFKKDRKTLLAEAEKLKQSRDPVRERFWLAESNRFTDFIKIQ